MESEIAWKVITVEYYSHGFFFVLISFAQFFICILKLGRFRVGETKRNISEFVRSKFVLCRFVQSSI